MYRVSQVCALVALAVFQTACSDFSTLESATASPEFTPTQVVAERLQNLAAQVNKLTTISEVAIEKLYELSLANFESRAITAGAGELSLLVIDFSGEDPFGRDVAEVSNYFGPRENTPAYLTLYVISAEFQNINTRLNEALANSSYDFLEIQHDAIADLCRDVNDIVRLVAGQIQDAYANNASLLVRLGHKAARAEEQSEQQTVVKQMLFENRYTLQALSVLRMLDSAYDTLPFVFIAISENHESFYSSPHRESVAPLLLNYTEQVNRLVEEVENM